jgi:hypothetical protein
MKACESLDMKGWLTLQKRNATNEVLEELTVPNQIVLSGRKLIAQMFFNSRDTAPFKFIAVGTGTADVQASDPKLQAEVFRKGITQVQMGKDITTEGDRAKLRISTELDFTEANDQPLTEAGVFTENPDSVMYNRVVFKPINKTKDFKLTLIWEIQF